MSSRPTLIWPAAAGRETLLLEAGETRALTSADTGSFDLVLPGQDVAIHPHSLPKMREHERVKAAGFAAEDKIGGALDAQHIALGSGADARMAVISKSKLSDILSQLTAANISVDRIFVDFDWAAPAQTPLRFSDRIIFPSPDGYTLDPDWLDPDWLGPNWTAAAGPELPLRRWSEIETQAASALNLAQGEFSRRSRTAFSAKGMGRLAAIFAAIAAAWLGLKVTQTRAVSAQAESIRAETAALYSAATGETAPLNPALAVTRALKSNPNPSVEFLPLLAQFNQAVSQTRGVAIDTLIFDSREGQLKLRLIYPEFDSAADIERAAQSSGGEFRAGGVREQNGTLKGDGVFISGDGS